MTPELHDVRESTGRRISPGDRVWLVPIRPAVDPEDTSVFLEAWEPGGAQPANSHPRSIETFLFLDGSGTAHCDGETMQVRAGQLLVLPAGSVHRIVDSGTGRLRAITTMAPDDGFTAAVMAGEEVPLTAGELALLNAL